MVLSPFKIELDQSVLNRRRGSHHSSFNFKDVINLIIDGFNLLLPVENLIIKYLVIPRLSNQSYILSIV